MKALSILFILIPASFSLSIGFALFYVMAKLRHIFCADCRSACEQPNAGPLLPRKRLRQDWERRLDAEKQKNCPQRNAAGGLPACVGMRSDAFKSHVLIVERRSDLDEQNSAASSGSFRFDDAAFEPGRPADGPIFCVWAGAEGIH